MNGFFNIIKPTGLTASDVVVRVRRATGMKKVGHLGTLDPAAAGVLPIAVGKGTKLFDFLLKKSKVYRAFFTFGKTTDSLDSMGVVLSDARVANLDEESIKKAITQMTGKSKQLPPQYSAKNVDGMRAYDLARKGIFVELKECEIEIFSFKLVSKVNEDTFCFDICCSSGTYIRSIARDLATRLNTVAFMSGLIRLSSGAFSLENAVTLEQLQQDPMKWLLPIEFPIEEVQSHHFDEIFFKQLENGVKIKANFPAGEFRKIYCNKAFFGIGKSVDEKLSMEFFLR